MLQLITVIAKGPGAVNIDDLSSSTGYPPSTVWTQTLSYASLAFSVLAAFGAVMGKQWLNSYKAARGRGSLEERGMQRQEKLDGLERWKLKTVLGAFLILLQISLFLFGLSLSANMWSQQTKISSVIMSTTAFGLLSYGVTILLSVLRPDSPFQTPGSAFVKAIRNKFRPLKSVQPPKSSIKLSAIRWVLETSTNPEVVAAAAAMVPRVQWPKPDASAIYARLLDNFAACLDRPELFVACGKAMAHLRVQSVNIESLFWKEYDTWRSWRDRSRFIRDSFTDGRLACDQLKNTKDEDTEQKQRHKADARTALRTMLVYGMSSHLSLPDEEKLIWEGDLRWRKNNGDTPQYEEFDWLIDYLAANMDDETQGDALLALSAMHGLGSSAKRPSYIQALIHCMGHTRPSRVRYAALRAVSDAREELCAIDSTQGVDTNLLDDLSRALLTARTGQDVPFHPDRDLCYFRVISTLTRSDEWCQRLVDHGHVNTCTSLLSYVLASPKFSLDLSFYLAGILARMDPSGGCSPFSQKEWQTLMRNAWEKATKLFSMQECVDALPALVTATRKNLPDPDSDVASGELADLTRYVNWVLEKLRQERPEVASVALPSVQGLSDDLRRIAHTRTPRTSA